MCKYRKLKGAPGRGRMRKGVLRHKGLDRKKKHRSDLSVMFCGVDTMGGSVLLGECKICPHAPRYSSYDCPSRRTEKHLNAPRLESQPNTLKPENLNFRKFKPQKLFHHQNYLNPKLSFRDTPVPWPNPWILESTQRTLKPESDLGFRA